jgi:hypothetical protein
MEMERKSHSMDAIQKALQEFENAVVLREKWSLSESKVMKQQDVDRARDRVVDEVMALMRKTIAEREGRAEKR